VNKLFKNHFRVTLLKKIDSNFQYERLTS